MTAVPGPNAPVDDIQWPGFCSIVPDEEAFLRRYGPVLALYRLLLYIVPACYACAQ